jgi:mannose-6-phosphate isomerase-like protein (cupin superfamily)
VDKSEYGKYFIKGCTNDRAARAFGDSAYANFDMTKVVEAFPEATVNGNGVVYFKPHVMVKDFHLHDFDEYLFFQSANMADMNDFDAEIEIEMGENGEIHTIKEPTVLYVPAGLKHCPLNFKVINKPVFFFHIRAQKN